MNERKHLILPLGLENGKEQDINTEISRITDAHNIKLQNARIGLAKDINNMRLPLDIKTKLMEELGDTPFIPTFSIIDSGRRATIGDARIILGDDFIAPDRAVRDLFPKDWIDMSTQVLSQNDKTVLLYTVKLLENIKQSSEGSVLVYQPAMKGGTAIGLDDFAKLCKGLSAKPDGVLLYADQFDIKKGEIFKKAWFQSKEYAAYREQQLIQPNVFRLATQRVIPNTPNKRFIPQIMTACDWMEKILYKGAVMPPKFKDAIAEIRKAEKSLTELQDNNVQQFLREIVNYGFWRYCMETGIETLYRLIAYNQVTEQKLFSDPEMYTRNCVTEPAYGGVGDSGFWYAFGPCLRADTPRDVWSRMGLSFSCTSE